MKTDFLNLRDSYQKFLATLRFSDSPWDLKLTAQTVSLADSRFGKCSPAFQCVRGTRTQPLICVACSVHYWVSCKAGFFEIAFVVVIDTHLPRFEALAYVLPHFNALTHVVICVSSAFIFQTFAEVCYSVFVNRLSFKSVLNLRKAYIFKSLLKVY